ncbi:hypothetical protein BOTBODRAFT_176706 [Botryobasidium botryosum FD-172 SS1]|uniref:Fungal-type protein kinase domain-containing protein n=1 Tax=Botryobasidium botryosum (strain FD-172 SS1) TaxID=930990 RepID=A0A067M9C4_BOTB1|nr:hypothetical protein BOTBODRAFT_176706 [Botryobasidium botryosum FD-172 SS1]
MAYSIGGIPVFKSDLPGTRSFPADTSEGHSVRRRPGDLAVAINDTWEILVAQVNAYARALFHTRKSRWFSLVISVRHDTCVVQFLFFHRGGLTSPQKLRLFQPDDFRTFVGTLCGIYRWKTPNQVGLYKTPLSSYVSDHRRCANKSVTELEDCICARGRTTRVYCIKTSRTLHATPISGATVSSGAAEQPHSAHIKAPLIRLSSSHPIAKATQSSAPVTPTLSVRPRSNIGLIQLWEQQVV